MNTIEITIKGTKRSVPVAANLRTMSVYEEIAKEGIFASDFSSFTQRCAIIYAAVVGADVDTDVEFKDIMNIESFKEFSDAFTAVIGLVNAFFAIPDVVKKAEDDEAAIISENDNEDTEVEAKNPPQPTTTMP